MKRLQLLLCASVLVAVPTVSTARVGDWRHQYYATAKGHPNKSAKPIDSIARWVNEECRPDRMADVKGLVSQKGGGGSEYNIHVFCRTGKGKLKVAPATTTWGPGGGPEFAKTLEGRSTVILGFYNGVKEDAVFMLEKVSGED
jgi:hypothetical protein